MQVVTTIGLDISHCFKFTAITASIAATVIFTMIEKAMGETPTVMDRKRREAWMRRHNLTRKHCR
jgi:hypothetical protein